MTNREKLNSECMNELKSCKICGKEFAKSPYSHMGICGSECFHTNYWQEIISDKEHHVVIDGVCYYLDRNNLHGSVHGFKGFDGHKFTIEMETGEIIETTNLWLNDTVPEQYRDALKDNARFIREALK